jgi:hypothetical protein
MPGLVGGGVGRGWSEGRAGGGGSSGGVLPAGGVASNWLVDVVGEGF